MTRPALSWKWIRIGTVVAVVIVAAATWSLWQPPLQRWISTASGRPASAEGGEAGHEDHADHAGHEDHPGHTDENSIALSQQARRNLGLTGDNLRPVALSTYRRTITVPAVIAERPGRTRLQVSAPMTGIVTHVHIVQGEAVQPGELLFELRLTHEDLVVAQTDFLKLIGELEVERKELQRLKGIAAGAIAGNILLERQYAVDKLTAQVEAQREALRLHDLTEEQVAEIESKRKLIRTVEIEAPEPDMHSESELQQAAGQEDNGAPAIEPHNAAEWLVLDDLRVHKGQAVTAGETLCVLSDYGSLFIEGQAFEIDAAAVVQAMRNNWSVSAVLDTPTGEKLIPDLSIAYISNEVHDESRTLHFYVNLPNERLDGREGEPPGRHLTWRYRPGQRLQLRVPVEEWENELVLPVAAVAREAAESYVFVQNGDHFDRVPVHVKHRDQLNVVIAQDGALFPGDMIALRGAHQLQMALKNKSGGGVDPHAGHTH